VRLVAVNRLDQESDGAQMALERELKFALARGRWYEVEPLLVVVAEALDEQGDDHLRLRMCEALGQLVRGGAAVQVGGAYRGVKGVKGAREFLGKNLTARLRQNCEAFMEAVREEGEKGEERGV
jgi:hypothetical protein